jgi:hypothetical protein
VIYADTACRWQMAAELTAQSIQTPRGGQWSGCPVRNGATHGLNDQFAAAQANSGTKAAHRATRPSAMPATVR